VHGGHTISTQPFNGAGIGALDVANRDPGLSEVTHVCSSHFRGGCFSTVAGPTFFSLRPEP
jgi:hypothetical protein